jgi:chondroitin-sulfate-ABC endolyase/exolyase
MKKTIFTFLLFYFVFPASAQSYYSFEDQVPTEWNNVANGSLSLSSDHYKAGHNSLKWNWNAGSVITVNNPDQLSENCKSSGSAIWAWVYNAVPRTDSLRFNFSNAAGQVKVGFNFKLNFCGWRFMWVCFNRDLKYTYTAGNELTKMSIVAPPTGSGSLYFDMVETIPSSSINWHRSSDSQYKVYESGAELRNNAYNQTLDISNVNLNDTVAANTIKQRLHTWFTGNSAYMSNPVYATRYLSFSNKINQFINSSWTYNQTLNLLRQPDNTVKATYKVNGASVGLFGDMSGYPLKFNDILTGGLFELAADAAIKNGTNVQRVIDFLDWIYDQGYAEGSGLGTGMTQLKSCGFPFAFFLVHKYITDDVKYERYMNAIRWLVLDTYPNPGASADEIRGATVSKLIYALCMKDPVKRVAELRAFKKYLENAAAISPGYFGLIKPDYSVYHHNMGYYSEYGDDAIHQVAMVMYFLSETNFALSDASYNNIKKATLNFADISSDYIVPASISGRFPGNSKTVADLLQAVAYVGLSKLTIDEEVSNTFNRLYNPSNKGVADVISGAGLGIQYTMGPGGAIALIDYKNKLEGITPKPALFNKYLPYSGLFAANKNDWAISIKGFSKYVIDFECIGNDGRYSRYLSYGNMQIMSGSRQYNNYTCDKSFDWVHFPGTTTINWPLSKIDTRRPGNNTSERNFHDENFLGGVTVNDSMGMFSMNMHDNVFNNTFKARKSVFYFGNMLYCMGSGIANNDEVNATHTTLFQNLSENKGLSMNGTALTTPYSQITTATQIIKNSWGNSYIVFPGSNTLSVQKRTQSGFNQLGTPTSDTDYEIAWLDHGFRPSNAKYNYAMLMEDDNTMKTALTNTTTPAIKVLRQETDAHIIQNTLSNTFAYSFFQALSNVNTLYGGIVTSVSQPCIVMSTSKSDDSFDLSFSNPDLNRPAYSATTENTPGTPILTTITLAGNYFFTNASADVSLSNQTNGTCIITFNAKNGANYTCNIKPKQTQTITITGNYVSKATGNGDFTLATATSDLPVSYSSSNTNVATIVNNKIHIVGSGFATITASQAGNEMYYAATSVTQSLYVDQISIGKAVTVNSVYNNSSTFNGAKAVDGITTSRWATNNGFSGATLELDLGGVYSFGKVMLSDYSGRVTAFTISYWNGKIWQDAYTNGTTIGALATIDFTTPVKGSKVRVSFTGTAISIYEFAVFGTPSKYAQTITFPTIGTKINGCADIDNATSNSGLRVKYSSSNTAVATILNDTIIHVVGAGSTTITASQAGNASYAAATPVTQNLVVAENTIAVNPFGDSFVHDGSPTANNGTAWDMWIKNNGANYIRKAYIGFKISGNNITQIANAKLRLYASYVDAPGFTIYVSKTTNNWRETTVTYLIRPTTGTSINSFTVNAVGQYELDVTSFVKSEFLVGADSVSFVLESITAANRMIKLNTKEASSNKPELVITQSLNPIVSRIKSNLDSDKANNKFNLNVYPNPIKDQLLITASTKNYPLKLNLYDINGRQLMYDLMRSDNHKFNTSSLPVGMYLLKVEDQESSEVFKVIKE